jgi:hypothetical protein
LPGPPPACALISDEGVGGEAVLAAEGVLLGAIDGALAGAAGGGALADVDVVDVFGDAAAPPAAGSSSHVSTPLWPRHAPRCDVPLNVVPSLHLAIGVPLPESLAAAVDLALLDLELLDFVLLLDVAALLLDAAPDFVLVAFDDDDASLLSIHVCTP